MIDYTILALQNPWWQKKEAIENDPKIKEFNASSVKYLPENILGLKLDSGAINIVFGPRQTGKSTAIKLLIKDLLDKGIKPETIFYFNCDALSSRQEVIDLLLSYFDYLKTLDGKSSSSYLFLDEISGVADWPYAVKWLADAGLLDRSYIILTGSSSISLKKSGEFMPGRRKEGKDIRFLPIGFAAYFKLLYPDFPLKSPCFSFRDLKKLETLIFNKGISLGKVYENFLLTGGFLKMIDLFVKKQPYGSTLELYLSTVKSELAKFGKKEINSRRILNKIITSITSETSYANIAEEAELGSKNTASDYLSFFADSFLLLEIPFYSIPQKRVIIKKNKKYYPADPFLLWVFSAFVFGSAEIESFYQRYLSPPLSSQLAEAFVAGELHKKGAEAFFFKNKNELDFYLPQKDLGIEVKYKDRIVSDDFEGLRYAKRKVLVSKNLLEERKDILIVPVYLFGFINWEQLDKTREKAQ